MRYLLVSLLTIFLTFISSKGVSASIVTVTSEGETVINVLSEQDFYLEIPQSESLEVREIAGSDSIKGSTIALLKDQDKFKLSVDSSGSEKTLDVTEVQENIIEIEERPETEKIAIKIKDDKFLLTQDKLIAQTDYEIRVNPEIAGITLSTPSGFRFLSIFPKGAVDTVLRARVMDRVENTIELNEGDDGALSYIVKGQKVINLFDLYEYKVPVKARISASTGEVLSIEQPEWLSIIGFLLV